MLALAACDRAGGEGQSKVVDGIRFDLTIASQSSQLSDGLADARPGSEAARPYRLLLKLSDAQSGAALGDAAAGVQVGAGRRSPDAAPFVATPVRQDGAAAYVATVNLTPGDQRLIFSVMTPVHGVPALAGFTYRLR